MHVTDVTNSTEKADLLPQILVSITQNGILNPFFFSL